MGGLNKNSIIAIIVVGSLALLSLFFKDELMGVVRFLLEKDVLRIVMILAVVVIVVTHTIMVGDPKHNGVFNVKSGSKPLDIALTCGTFSAVSTTACSILEGSYIQQFYGDVIYFKQFSELDIYVLFGVSALLIWYVIFNISMLCRELMFYGSDQSVDA